MFTTIEQYQFTSTFLDFFLCFSVVHHTPNSNLKVIKALLLTAISYPVMNTYCVEVKKVPL